MGIPFLILLAVVWALFALWGFRRGTNASLLMTVLIILALLALSLFPGLVRRPFQVFNEGMSFFLESDRPFIRTDLPNLTMLVLAGTIVFAFLLGLLKMFRGKHSFAGFVLGLLNGYLFTAYALAALVPGRAILPLLIKIEGLTTVSLATAAAAPPSTGLVAELVDWLQSLVQLSCAPYAIVVLIVGFIALALISGGRGGKKG